MSTDNLILQRDIMNLLNDYADRYPLASCDKTTRQIGALLRHLMLDVLMEVPITASIYTDTHKFNANQHTQCVESVETMSCQECTHWIFDDRWGWFCPLKSQDECRYELKDEPQVIMPKKCKGCDSASKIIEAYSRGYTDGANAVKAMPQTFTADGIVFAKMTEAEQTEPNCSEILNNSKEGE